MSSEESFDNKKEKARLESLLAEVKAEPFKITAKIDSH
jgi:Txe/YoeB family toxin of Txe-Axe toxin-antitoxin module